MTFHATQWLHSLVDSSKTTWTAPLLSFLIPLFVRWAVSLNPYSGYNTPPMYGDYEAQRHWMEITQYLDFSQWYKYELDWWGLDYPPLTAYHSWLCGVIGTMINPDWFLLDSSRGYESPESKFFMRTTVIVSEALIYTTALWYFCRMVYPTKKYSMHLLIMIQPALIIIDHGHFQYNSVMLGLSLWAINGFLSGHYILGSIAFCLSLAFKQMALYYAVAVFAFLLGKCIKAATPMQGLVLLVKLGLVVIVSFTVLFLPWLGSLDQIQQVIHRIFPVARGLYEDKVANIWCALNVVVKLRNLMSLQSTVRLSLCATLIAIIPINIHLGLLPSPARFGYALVNTSLAFFLLSFQVHEKSILIPLLPVSLMLNEEPQAVQLFMNVAMFSMFPLLKREGLMIPYFCITLLWNYMIGLSTSLNRHLNTVVYVTLIAWHFTEAYITPPERLPDLFAVLNAIISCGYFVLLWIFFLYRQFVNGEPVFGQPLEKKKSD
ncbi:ALG6, ALG8 glycosyltransferase [Lichtheimia hyalospora FSU 10163]|nr:ALG6, ALG8 glycosyltransferase [Lichtheimia hyalospora FSU 10163]